MSIGKLYYSHSTARGSAGFKTLPFHDATIDWKKSDASTMSFKSPVKLQEADRIRYKNSLGRDFGGQIYKVKKSVGEDYDYEVISYLRLYHDKVTCSFKNLTSSQIMKKVLKLSKNNFRTSGIKDTKIIHSSLKWENTSIWDIAQQLCWLEHQAGYEVRCSVDAIGTLLFNYAPKQEKGYSFRSVLDYEEEHDSSDIITQFSVNFKGKEIATSSASKGIIAKWGYVSDSEECQAEQDTSPTTKTEKSTGLRNDAMIQKYNIPSKIVNLALSIAKEGNTDYQNMKLLFNWCNKNISYVGYSNSVRGALGCLNKRGGNCCDNANLLIALARSIGIKSRYAHAKMGSQGHVYGEYYLNNKWITIDTGTTASKNRNVYWGGHWNGFGGTDARYEKLSF